MSTIRIAVIGMGKIARDQHLPAIDRDPNFILTATVSPDDAGMDGVPHYASLDSLLAAGPTVDAVALCTPPQVRHALAVRAIAGGAHVFLEKPPGASLSEVASLERAVEASGRTMFAGWHSRFAAGIEPARAWLGERRIVRVAIVWREDVRVWHPGQDWIWRPGGLGVFDPGINALSIVTHILPRPFHLVDATLKFPENRAAPIAAELTFRDDRGVPIAMDLDWRQTGPQSWDIIVETDAGTLKLAEGGAVLSLPGGTQRSEDQEYRGLYARFATLIHERRSEIDVDPLRLVADAFLLGRRDIVEAFND
ncbi:MAG TPA: Gfo/Idh/MocA family oxidoreductase [Sphingomonas sp.]